MAPEQDTASAQLLVPRFAVVGRVNKGKSSVIATLAEDDRVAISSLPGTTRKASEFPVRLDDRVLFSLIDTPGFEQAPAALAWLEQEPVRSDQREARVGAFVDTFAGSGDFTEECDLLGPILKGAAILYVVDGDKPYRDNYRAEMEILRYTGQPSMALINRGGDGEHVEEWRRALNQYFKVVREFDAHKASFEERIRLLTTLRELHDPYRKPIEEAVVALLDEAERRRTEAVHIVAGLLEEALTYAITTRGEGVSDPRKLEARFHDHLRGLEKRARDRLSALYHHDQLIWSQAQELVRPVFGEDLFAERTWASLGLSATQLLATYTVSGAITGGIIDASTFGASFGTGAILGALAGAGATAFHLSKRFEQASRLGGITERLRDAGGSGPAYIVGPFKHPNFPFVLLDRALRYYEAVRNRAHALSAAGQRTVEVGVDGKLGERMEPDVRKALATVFTKIQKRRERVPPELRMELYRLLDGLLPAVPGRSALV